MQYQLDLVLKPMEGALIRALGVTERRGFTTQFITGTPDQENGNLRVCLIVKSERCVNNLRIQLQKLYDCESVDVKTLSEPSVVSTL